MSAAAIAELYETPGIHLFGLPMSQSFADVLLWERLLNAHPVLGVIEIGTGEGGFSRFLATQGVYRGFDFATFDIVEPEALVPGFSQVDVLAEPDRVAALLDRHHHPVILFCDGGNKVLEMQTFAPLLSIGDLLVVHDWGSEVGARDVPPELAPLHLDWTRELRCLARVFERIDPAAGLAACTEMNGCLSDEHLSTCPQHASRKEPT